MRAQSLVDVHARDMISPLPAARGLPVAEGLSSAHLRSLADHVQVIKVISSAAMIWSARAAWHE